MKTKLAITAIAASVAMFSTASLAMPGPGAFDPEKREARMQKRVEKMLKKVEASDAQASQIKAVFAANKSRMQQLAKDRHAVHKALKALDPMAPNYQAQVDSLAQRKGSLVTESVRLRSSVRQQVASILTPEQRAKWEAWQAKRKERRAKRWSEHRAKRKAEHGGDH